MLMATLKSQLEFSWSLMMICQDQMLWPTKHLCLSQWFRWLEGKMDCKQYKATQSNADSSGIREVYQTWEKCQRWHERNYASVGMAFVLFVLGCLVKAALFLYILAFLELRQMMVCETKLGSLCSQALLPTACNFMPTAFFKARLGFLLLFLRLLWCVSLVLQVCLPLPNIRMWI